MNILSRIQALAAISEDSSCLTRTFGSMAFTRASQLLLQWMQEAGLDAHADNIGNVRGRWRSPHPQAKTLVIASHFDTVVNAGRYDGILGVLMAIEIASTQTALPFHIEVVAFCDEEGVRYHTTYLGSQVLAGTFDHALLDKKDAAGISLSDAIRLMGGAPDLLKQDQLPPDQWLGYFEIHIEQGPVLYEKNIPTAVVTAIAGQQRSQLIFSGMAGHAGTVPMEMRQDALCCAAECVLLIEQWALQHRDQVLATVGTIQVVHAASNVIPGEVECSLDLRSSHADMLQHSQQALFQAIAAICDKRKIGFAWNIIQETAPVHCDPALSLLLEQAIIQHDIELIKLVSGAGHDAVAISKAAPVCMLFVRCYKGISHHPLEDVEATDIAAALAVANTFIHQLSKYGDLSTHPFSR
jgi:allantoate deiminase